MGIVKNLTAKFSSLLYQTIGESININDGFFTDAADKIAELFKTGKLSNWDAFYKNKNNLTEILSK